MSLQSPVQDVSAGQLDILRPQDFGTKTTTIKSQIRDEASYSYCDQQHVLGKCLTYDKSVCHANYFTEVYEQTKRQVSTPAHKVHKLDNECQDDNEGELEVHLLTTYTDNQSKLYTIALEI